MIIVALKENPRIHSEIQNGFDHFFAKKINPRSLGSLCMKGTKESVNREDSLVPLMHHDLSDLGLICKLELELYFYLNTVILSDKIIAELRRPEGPPSGAP